MRVAGIAIVAAIALGCTSPEATRMRAGGRGGDPGNRSGNDVQMHEGSTPYWKTPERLPRDARMRDLEPARHAHTLSVERDGSASASPRTDRR
jgi:hypothetical protein